MGKLDILPDISFLPSFWHWTYMAFVKRKWFTWGGRRAGACGVLCVKSEKVSKSGRPAGLAVRSLVSSRSSLRGVCVWAKSKAWHTPSAAAAQSETLLTHSVCPFVWLLPGDSCLLVAGQIPGWIRTLWHCGLGTGPSCRGPGQPGPYLELPPLLTTKPNKPSWCWVSLIHLQCGNGKSRAH